MSGHNIVYYLAWPALIAVAAFAWWKGDRPVRLSGGMFLISSIVAWLIDHTLGRGPGAVPMLINDGLLAFGFLAVAMRYGSLWLAAVMLLQGVQFSLHAYYFVVEKPHDLFYGWVNNLDTYGLMACLLGGGIVAMRRRAEARRNQPLAQPASATGAAGPVSS